MNSDRVILGESCIFSSDSKETGLNNNILVCGGSGCGKTVSVSEARLLETKNSSLIATVTKRRIVNKYKPMFEDRGYKVLDLNFTDPERGSTGFDPLKYVSSYRDITLLAESIVMADPRKGYSHADPFWDDNAVSLLSAEIGYVMMVNDNATFADVLDFHDSIKLSSGQNDSLTTNVDGKFAALPKEETFVKNCWNTFKNLCCKTASTVFSTLNTAIDTVFTPEVRLMMRMEETVDFGKLASEKTVLFITTSPVENSMNCCVNIFYSSVFRQLFEFAEKQPDGMLPLPVHVLCDDFATGGRILNFAEYISIFREKRVSVTLLLQSESQLEAMYGEHNATTIINNCDSYLYMGGMDIKTARNVSLRLNTPIEDVLYMPVGSEIVFRRGIKPVITKRYDISQNDEYKEVTRQYEERLAD